MCKIFTITGAVSRPQVHNLLALTNKVFAETQHDGFGFLSIGKTLAFGRYRFPDSFPGFDSHLPSFLLRDTSETGVISNTSSALLIHGRHSTNERCLENVHPFVLNDMYLVHNGVLDYVGKGNEPKPKNKCDSEAFLMWLQDNAPEFAFIDWSGYGAIFTYSKSEGLTLIKCSSSRLSVAKRKGNNGYVFSTDSRDLVEICESAGIKLASNPISVPQCIVNFGVDGSIVQHRDWQGFGSRKHDKKSWQSLGKKVTEWSSDGGIKVLTESGVQTLSPCGVLSAAEVKEQKEKKVSDIVARLKMIG
jgi:predicted glutamine amidotransferase